MTENIKIEKKSMQVADTVKEIINENPDAFFTDLMEEKAPSMEEVRELIKRSSGGESKKVYPKRTAVKAAGYILAVLIGAGFLTVVFDVDEALADRLGLKNNTYESQNRGSDGDVRKEKNKVTLDISSWEDAKTAAAEFLPELVMPKEVPEGYVFEKVNLVKWPDGSWEATFSYKGEAEAPVQLYTARMDQGRLYSAKEQPKAAERLKHLDGSYYQLADAKGTSLVCLAADYYWIVSGVEELDACKELISGFSGE